MAKFIVRVINNDTGDEQILSMTYPNQQAAEKAAEEYNNKGYWTAVYQEMKRYDVNESLTEDLIVIEPFEAKEKLNKLVAQIKEQEDDEIKKSLLELLNIYLFQTYKPSDRESSNITDDEWNEISEFHKEETDKYFEEHPEELPGTEEHAEEEKSDADSEEVNESLTEDVDPFDLD